jgi:hypothetical protein
MTDINSEVNPVGPTDTELRQAMELLFYAYRDFTADADAMLAKIGLGRAHHRVIYFVGRYPGITVSDLLAILRIWWTGASWPRNRAARTAASGCCS